MKIIKSLMFVLILSVFAISTTGCEEKGAGEKAGEQLDKAAEDAGKKVNELLGK